MSRSDDLSDAVIDRLEGDLEAHGFFQWLDLDLVTAERGRVVCDVPFDEKYANVDSGAVHGGVAATVIDAVSAFALRTTFEDPDTVQLTTTDLNVRYVRPVYGDIRVEATVVRAGETMGYTEGKATTVHEGERKTVATGGTSYRLFRD